MLKSLDCYRAYLCFYFRGIVTEDAITKAKQLKDSGVFIFTVTYTVWWEESKAERLALIASPRMTFNNTDINVQYDSRLVRRLLGAVCTGK